jgi:hypothetical protein
MRVERRRGHCVYVWGSHADCREAEIEVASNYMLSLGEVKSFEEECVPPPLPS